MPAMMMLIDRAVSAYLDFVWVGGWVGNLATSSSAAMDRARSFGIGMAEREPLSAVSLSSSTWLSCARTSSRLPSAAAA